jgi:hypothetical protein
MKKSCPWESGEKLSSHISSSNNNNSQKKEKVVVMRGRGGKDHKVSVIYKLRKTK